MKDKILKIAQEQMKSGGYENLNFSKIAEDLSTTRANLHHHFKNKEGLAFQATQKYIEESSQKLMGLFTANKGDFPSFISDVESFFFEEAKSNGRCGGCVCSQLIREPNIPSEILKLAQSHFDNIKIGLEIMIKESQENGLIKKSISPEELAYLTMSTLFGMGHLAMVHGDDPKFLKKIKGTLVRLVNAYKD